MNMRLAYVLFFFSLLIAFYLGVYKPTEEPKTFRSPQSQSQSNRAAPARSPAGAALPSRDVKSSNPGTGESTSALDPEEFRRKYGDHLKWVHGRSGEVIGLLSQTESFDQWEKHQRAEKPFHPRNRGQVLARADQVIRDAADLLQLDTEFPLGNVQLSQTDSSVQVVYDQTHRGIPLSEGRVTLLFGPEGELRSLESDYIRGVRITNRVPAKSPPGGRTILWVGNRTERRAETRYASETRQSGIQTVRDAETGEIIYQRNRRIH